MTKFKIGDAVICKGAGTAKDIVGVVRAAEADKVGIECLTKRILGHNLSGQLERGSTQGWWVSKFNYSTLKIIEPAERYGFRIGDRVVSVKGIGGNDVAGARGTVVGFAGGIAVLFDKDFNISGHKLDGYPFESDRPDGWFCAPSNIEHISPKSATPPPEATKDKDLTAEDKDFKTFIEYIRQVPEQYLYIARDKDGKLFAYIDEPKIDVGGIQFYSKRFKKIKDDLFPALKFESGVLKIREVKGDE